MYLPNEGWRQILERMYQRLEAAIAAEPPERRSHYEIAYVKAKFGQLVVHLAHEGTPEMEAAIKEAQIAAATTCEVCGAPGLLAERGPLGWWAVRCGAHETWSRLDHLTDRS